MKKLTYLFSTLMLLSILTIIGCSKDDDPGLTDEEVQLAALSATWVATSVSDGTNPNRQDYDGFTLTLNSDMSYSTAAGPDLLPMPEAGKYAFGTNVKSNIIIAPSISATYSLSDNAETLTIQFTYTGSGFENTRTESVNGDWTFVFDKQ